MKFLIPSAIAASFFFFTVGHAEVCKNYKYAVSNMYVNHMSNSNNWTVFTLKDGKCIPDGVDKPVVADQPFGVNVCDNPMFGCAGDPPIIKYYNYGGHFTCDQAYEDTCFGLSIAVCCK